MNIFIKYIERTSFVESVLKRVIKKYICKTKNDVFVIFDKRCSIFGSYAFNIKKQVHEIRLGVNKNKKLLSKKDLPPSDEKYVFISTLLHEIKHLNQREEMGKDFWNKDFGLNKNIKNMELAERYSKCESEAREFEEKNVLKAVEFYDSLMKNFKKRKP